MNQLLSEIVPTVLVAISPRSTQSNTEPAVYRRHGSQWRDSCGRSVTDPMWTDMLNECWEQQSHRLAHDQQLAALRDLFSVANALPVSAVETLTCVAKSFLQDPEPEEEGC